MTPAPAPLSMLNPRVLIPFVVATVIWGSTWIVIHDQLGVVPPAWSIAYRFFIGSAAMFVWATATGAPKTLPRAGHLYAALLGFALFCLNFNFVYHAEGRITSGLVAVVFALLIVPNAVFARIFLKQPLSARFLVGSGIALIGVAMLIVQEARADTSSGDDTIVGVALTLAGVVAASAANVFQAARRVAAMPTASLLAWGMFWGGWMNAALAWFTTGDPVIETRTGYLIGVVYLGVFASAVAFACYNFVLRAVGPGNAAYSSVLTPVFAMILSTLFEDYEWTALAAGGGAVAMAGLVVAMTARKPVAKSG